MPSSHDFQPGESVGLKLEVEHLVVFQT